MRPASAEQSVFAEALQRATPEARLAYLDAACGTDTVLRRRVEPLLRAADNAGDFLEQPPTGLGGDADSTALGSEPGENPGSRIGRYKLLEKIGEGGCGVVYMAEQEEPVRRRVALKIIKLGMDTRSVVARFEAEQQALALDVRRHLSNEAVLARPPSASYRFQKLVRRNKLAFAAIAAVSCALVLGVVASAGQAVRATRARSEAVAARENEAQQRRKAEAQELAARQRAYSSDMTLAEQALEANNLGMALELVERQEPEPGRRDLRGWEWRHLWGRTRSDELFALRGHSNEVPIALFLHDGRTAFSGSCDHTLKFWNLEKRSVVESIFR